MLHDPVQEPDMLLWSTAAEQELALAEPAQCPTDGNIAKPEDAETVEQDPARNFSPDIDSFRTLNIVETPRKAPPCGPTNDYYKVCCLDMWGDSRILTNCKNGRFDFKIPAWDGRRNRERAR